MTAGWRLEHVTVLAEDRIGGVGGGELLRDVTFASAPGTLTLIVGRNGAGKTTLLETMAGLRTLAAGRIEVDGLPLWRGAKPRREALLRYGAALQRSESQWFARSIREELHYSMKPYGFDGDERERRAAAALEQAGLPAELLAREPWTLSGGQQRRLAWACLAAAGHGWLLLDEPTSGLDDGGIRLLRAFLGAHKAQGRGAVVATHDLDALWPLADAVVELDDGAVREAASVA
ncbi:ABC transporter ATP-binding protein, partial [uncultured Paenibacillus sp.]